MVELSKEYKKIERKISPKALPWKKKQPGHQYNTF